MNKDVITSKYFWKATARRALKTFLQTILGVWTAGMVLTEIDWPVTLVAAFSAAVYSVLTSIYNGLPEVDIYEYEGDENGNEK